MIFAARQIQEKCREQNNDLHCVFVDLTKAFDTVSRDGLWKILAKVGCQSETGSRWYDGQSNGEWCIFRAFSCDKWC